MPSDETTSRAGKAAAQTKAEAERRGEADSDRRDVVDRRFGLDRRRGPGRRRSDDRKAAAPSPPGPRCSTSFTPWATEGLPNPRIWSRMMG